MPAYLRVCVPARARSVAPFPTVEADALLLPLPAVASVLSVERLLENAQLGDALVSASGAVLAKMCRSVAECRSQLASEGRAMRRLLRTTVELLQHDRLEVRADALTVVEELAADGATYTALLQTGAMQNVLDLLERTAVSAAELTADAATAGTDAAARAKRLAEGERRGALRFLAALAHQDVTLTALFEDHPALDGVVLPGHDAVQARREGASAFGHHANFARAAVREGKVGVGVRAASLGGPPAMAAAGGGGATVRRGTQSRPAVAPVYERPAY